LAFTGKIEDVRFDLGDGTDLTPAERRGEHLTVRSAEAGRSIV